MKFINGVTKILHFLMVLDFLEFFAHTIVPCNENLISVLAAAARRIFPRIQKQHFIRNVKHNQLGHSG